MDARHMRSESALPFEANTPVQVAVKFDGGRDVDGRYGRQVLYTLADARLMYLEPKAACRIDELKITAGEPFSICKREGKNGQKRTVEWEVKRLEPVPTTARLKIVPPGEATKRVRLSLRLRWPSSNQAMLHGRPVAALLQRQIARHPAMNGSKASTLET